jgi:hypothetical protein
MDSDDQMKVPVKIKRGGDPGPIWRDLTDDPIVKDAKSGPLAERATASPVRPTYEGDVDSAARDCTRQ